jgi:transposase
MRVQNEKYSVELTKEQRAELEAIGRLQRTPAAKARRARILLLADESQGSGKTDAEIAAQVGLSERQVVRIRQKFVREGFAPSLERRQRLTPPTPRKFDGRGEAQLVTLACSTPPEGRERWTLQLLADATKRLKIVSTVSPETVRRCLKKTDLNLGNRSGSASPKQTAPDSSRTWRKRSTSTVKRMTSDGR